MPVCEECGEERDRLVSCPYCGMRLCEECSDLHYDLEGYEPEEEEEETRELDEEETDEEE